MSIAWLEGDVKELAEACSEEIRLAPCEKLPAEPPACVKSLEPGYEILYSPTLTGQDRDEALGHELGHLLLHYRGLINCEAVNPMLDSYLKAEINNVISYSTLIDILKQKYDISSDLHLKLRQEGLAARAENLLSPSGLEYERLCGIGVALYDTARTVPALASEARAQSLATMKMPAAHMQPPKNTCLKYGLINYRRSKRSTSLHLWLSVRWS